VRLSEHTTLRLGGPAARLVEAATDDELVAAMRVFAATMKLVVEPTGCLGLAGVRAAGDLAGQRVGVLVSGGNVDLARFAHLVGACAPEAEAGSPKL
jgi:threonine dehydratase